MEDPGPGDADVNDGQSFEAVSPWDTPLTLVFEIIFLQGLFFFTESGRSSRIYNHLLYLNGYRLFFVESFFQYGVSIGDLLQCSREFTVRNRGTGSGGEALRIRLY